jgi:hypothetical protein
MRIGTLTPVRIRLLVPITVSLALLLAACGGSSGPKAGPSAQGSSTTTAATGASGPTTSVHVAKPVSATPSVSAKMICESDAQNEIYQQAIGVKTVSVTTPTWIDHVYTCAYVYPGGARITLSVKELADVAETTAYFETLATKLGKTKDNLGVGQGSFQVRGGSVVVRKDFKVLLVDVTKLPAHFGVPTETPGDAAINVAEAIMGCWTGA